MYADTTLPVRFWRKVDREATGGCWIWTAAADSKGYGNISLGGRADRRALRAHRVAYELLVGPIPAGLDLDHACRNRRCVNPAHLEPVTRRENLRRSPIFTGNRTRCVHGHALDEANTYVAPKTGRRSCKECRRRATRESHRRRGH